MQTTASTIRTTARRRISRARQLIAALSTVLLWTVVSVQVSFAQGGGDPTGSLGTKLDELTESLAQLGRPVAAVALTLAVLSYILEPALPDMARENKGMIRKVLFACIGLGIVPDLVNFAFG